MIAPSVGQLQRMPVYTGSVFPHGRGGRNVPVYLLTDNTVKAQKLGRRLNAWGCPFSPILIQHPHLETALVLNPLAEKKFEPMLGCMSFPIVKFGGDPVALETRDMQEVMAFAKWMTERWERYKKDKVTEKMKNPSLEDLADAGEIETID